MKVGILTLYYKNYNFGGQLQAYALQKFLRNNSVNCEQICFQKSFRRKRNSNRSIKKILKGVVWNILNIFVNRMLKKRYMNFQKFSESIPHTNNIYTFDNIEELKNYYDCFICGSDQIWNDTFNSKEDLLVYCLDFVNDKRKISYAASIGSNELSSEQANLFRECLNKFDAISVRENTAKKLLESLISKEIITVLDPTLLLSAEQWNTICKEPDKCKQEPYLFAYLLGRDKKQRKIASDIAKIMKLKLWTIPHVYGNMRTCDIGFGDIKDFSSGPAEFIGLIKNANLVITDSFHAVVFSIIFHKPFFVFKRNSDNDPKSMNSRIIDFLSELGLERRIINSNDINLNDIDIDYNQADKILEEKRSLCIEFLKNSLNIKN